MAEALGLPPERLALVPGDGLERTLRALVGPGERVALCLPERPAFERAVLGAGAAYVDIGRDAAFRLQRPALERILEDGVAALALGRPSLVSGELPDVEEWLEHPAIPWLIVDETGLPWSGEPSLAAARSLSSIVVRSLPWRAPAVDAVLGAPEIVDLVRLLGPPLDPHAAATAAAWDGATTTDTSRRDRRRGELLARGWSVPESHGPCLLALAPGADPERGGLHWSWRGGAHELFWDAALLPDAELGEEAVQHVLQGDQADE